MKRILTQHLETWANSKKRKPLVLLGARQVGKTYTLREFSRSHYKVVHEINFQSTPSVHKAFAGELDAARIIRDLELILGKPISMNGDETLFFDEIQDCPRALTSLKYFCDKMPNLPIMAAGSLLGINLAPTPFPVGCVDILYMSPMSFAEVLAAQPNARLYEAYAAVMCRQTSLSEVAHDQLWDAFKNYLCTGGLPEVVDEWIKNGANNSLAALLAARKVLGILLTAYMADIAKHAGKVNAMHIERVWRSIPQQLASALDGSTARFKFKDVVPGIASYRDLSGPLDWLVRAHNVLKVPICHEARSPIAAFTKENIFKMYVFDSGILTAMLNLQPGTIQDFGFGTYKGYIAENFVAGELLATRPMPSEDSLLHAWSEGSSEIEFLLETSRGPIPIEVKSGNRIRSQSLRSFNERYKPTASIILSARPPAETKDGPTCKINLPIYLASSIWQLPMIW